MKSLIFSSYALTHNAKIKYSIEVSVCSPSDCINFVDTVKFRALCEAGCRNYAHKWSCPPYSPTFMDFASKWETQFILFMYVDMAQFSYIKNDYLKIKAANTILKSRADKFLRYMAVKHGTYISTGSCRLCKPCKCKTGLPCSHPELMAYSFEAMDVNVGMLVGERFHKSLLWYNPHCLPEYTSVVCGLLTNSDITVHDLQYEYKNFITD